MDSSTKTYFTASYIFYLILGILYCITIIGVIVGIPMIIGANKFNKARDLSVQELKQDSESLFIWGIVLGVLTVPIGIIFIIYAIGVNDKIKGASNSTNSSFQQGLNNIGSSVGQAAGNVKEGFKKTTDLDSKLQKIEQLKKMQQEGLITEEEYQALRKKTLDL